MTLCEEFAVQLSEPKGSVGDAVRSHAATCEMCRALLAVDSDLRAAPTPRALEMSFTVRQAVEADHRAIGSNRRWLHALTDVSAALIAPAWFYFLLHDSASPQSFWFFATSTAWLTLMFCGFFIMLAPGQFGLGIEPRTRLAFVSLTLLAFEIVVWTVRSPSHLAIGDIGFHHWLGHWVCAPIGIVLALLVGAVVFVTSRRTAIVSPQSAGAVRGTVAALSGVMCLQIWCRFPDPLHFAIFHAAPLVVSIALGMWVGRKYLAA